MLSTTSQEQTNKLSIVARQPILDKNKDLFAFELLYREGEANAFPTSSSRSTLRLLSEQFLTFQKRNLDGKPGFVNFEHSDIVNGVPFDFSPNDIVVEILETCSPTDELFNSIVELKEKNYLVALDDFQPSSEWDRFCPLVDFIKLDVRELSFVECKRIIHSLDSTDIQFVAEKVENHEEFLKAQACGFSLFQGYFFQKPEIIKTHKLSASALDIFKLSTLVAKRDVDLNKVNQIIERNPVLSVQLLNFVNSDSRVSKTIESTRQALAYLGDDRIRKYVTYTTLAALSPNKPNIILRNLLNRAKFIECLASHLDEPTLSDSAYLCGMLSLVDGLLDMALTDVLSSLPLSDIITHALVDREGTLGNLLSIAEAIEASNWVLLDKMKAKVSLSEETIMECLTKSNAWVSELAA
ncbi:signal transduction protein [Vibrio galatheae]|uniref:Signal transduction protein n=1 Tax=Vibrio galatheae TaxID=579748 RepID=A0A0F4NQJ1_9VIBR|nr:HDOD domain-containing protein [Vibrio galatheae]KJY85108.1 signal transduction protein [Vibrio galatheae]